MRRCRNEQDNAQLQYMHALPNSRSRAILSPSGFPGPTAIIIGPPTPFNIRQAAGLIVRHAGGQRANGGWIEVSHGDQTYTVPAEVSEDAMLPRTIAESTRRGRCANE